MALTLRQMVQALDAEMDLAKEECTEFVAEHSSWLEEAVAANTKQILYKSNREFECPRSHRKPTRSKRKVGLTAVSEEPEEKENTSHNPEDRSHAKRGLASRNNHTNMKGEEVGSKRKSDSSGDLEENAKQPREETKRINRDQLAEINAAAAWASSPRVLQAVAQTTEGASVDYVQMKVPELRSKLEELGLSSQGRKDDLITRLKVADLNAKKLTITDLKAKKVKLAEVKAIVRETGLADDGKMSDLLDRLETHFSEGNNDDPGHEESSPLIEPHVDNDTVEPQTSENADLDSKVQEQTDELEEKEPTRETTSDDPQGSVVEQNAPTVEDDDDGLSEVNDIGVPPSEPAPVPVVLEAPAVAVGQIESVEEQASQAHGSDDEECEGEQEAQKQIGHLDVEDQLDGRTMKSTDVDAIEVELVDASPTAGKGGICCEDESIDASMEMPRSGQLGPRIGGAEVESSARLQEKDTTCAATDDPEAADEDEAAHLSTTSLEQQSGASKLVKGLKRVGERHVGSSVSPGLSPRPNHLRPGMNVSGGYAMCDELQRKLQARQARLKEQVSLSAVQESEDADAVDGIIKVEKHEREVPRSLPAPSQHDDKRRAKEAAEARQREAAEQRRREEKEAAEQRRAKETAVKEAAEQKKREEKEAAEQKIRAKELAAEQRAKEAAEQRRREKEAAEQKAKEAAELRAKKVRAEEQRLKEKLQLEEKRAEEKRALLDKRKEDKDEKKEIQPKKITRKSQAANAHGSQARGAAPSAQAAPALPEGWAEYFDKKTERTYFHNAISKTTTWSRPGVEPAAIGSSNGKKRVFSTESCASQQYPIDETKPESTSDEGSDSEDEEEQKKKVPRWVERSKLMPQIELQQNIDADEVFGQRIHEQEVVCDLEDIFGHSDPKKRYHRRTSSGCWDQDKLTSPEEHIYKTALGFFR
ncbi:hypothetical protein AB1Y20_008455 [Prymnesium parvum]|uniref:SAP domain-containing protein n=1 Tax=Prymnesium parvum TaxID=97485 RepID=A0AB34IRJ0_PRYPA